MGHVDLRLQAERAELRRKEEMLRRKEELLKEELLKEKALARQREEVKFCLAGHVSAVLQTEEKREIAF